MKLIPLLLIAAFGLSACQTTTSGYSSQGLGDVGRQLVNIGNTSSYNTEATCQNMERGVVRYNRAWYRRNCYGKQ